MEQPKIPTLKDAQKPQVKLKGLGAGLTMLDRLKQFKKKDLAFILAGLGTLFMAPLAEHFMMSPENGDGQLQQGWGGGRGASTGLFGSGGSPYEGGLNGISQGGAIGGGGDIITPLNVRDPSALIMGPGSSQQPPAGAATPPTPPPTAPARSDSDMRDALAASAARAATAATKKAPLPVPKVALGGSGLRGLGAASGGSSSSAGLGPIAGGPRSAADAGGGGLNMVRAAPGYRGAAGARGSSNPTGLDNVKKAAGQAGDAFSRTGNALSGLQEAAGQNIPQGGSGFGGNGQGGAGPNDKGPGGSGPGGSKSVGESLAFIAAKQRMEKELELEFEKRKKGDPELLWYDIRNEMLKTIANKGIAEPLAEAMKGLVSSTAAGADGAAETMIACPGFRDGKPLKVGRDIQACNAKNDNTPCFRADTSSVLPGGTSEIKCSVTKTGSSSETTPRSGEGVNGGSDRGVNRGASGEQARALSGLKELCDKLGSIKGGSASEADPVAAQNFLNAIEKEAAQLVQVRDALYNGDSKECADAMKKYSLGNVAKNPKDEDVVSAKQKAAYVAVLKGGDGLTIKIKNASKVDNKADHASKKEAVTRLNGDFDESKADTPAGKASTARKALTAVTTAVGADLSKIDTVTNAWNPETSVRSMMNDRDEDKKKANQDFFSGAKTTLMQARGGLQTELDGMVRAQKELDGKDLAPNGAGNEAVSKQDAVLPELKAMVMGEGDTKQLPTVVDLQGNYYTRVEGKPGAQPTAGDYAATKEGVGEGIQASNIELQKPDKPEGETVPEGEENPYFDAEEAGAAVLGTQKALSGRVDAIFTRTQNLRDTIPGK